MCRCFCLCCQQELNSLWPVQSYQDLCKKHPSFRERSENADLAVRALPLPALLLAARGNRCCSAAAATAGVFASYWHAQTDQNAGARKHCAGSLPQQPASSCSAAFANC